MTDHIVAVDLRVLSNSPEEIEARVTNPLESAMKSLAGLRLMNSISTHGRCMLELDFEHAPSLETLDIVQKAIQAARPQLGIEVEVISISIRPPTRS